MLLDVDVKGVIFSHPCFHWGKIRDFRCYYFFPENEASRGQDKKVLTSFWFRFGTLFMSFRSGSHIFEKLYVGDALMLIT